MPLLIACVTRMCAACRTVALAYNQLLYRPPDPPLEQLEHALLYPLNPDLDFAALEDKVLIM